MVHKRGEIKLIGQVVVTAKWNAIRSGLLFVGIYNKQMTRMTEMNIVPLPVLLTKSRHIYLNYFGDNRKNFYGLWPFQKQTIVIA